MNLAGNLEVMTAKRWWQTGTALLWALLLKLSMGPMVPMVWIFTVGI